jgi:hypothetical protein
MEQASANGLIYAVRWASLFMPARPSLPGWVGLSVLFLFISHFILFFFPPFFTFFPK